MVLHTLTSLPGNLSGRDVRVTAAGAPVPPSNVAVIRALLKVVKMAAQVYRA